MIKGISETHLPSWYNVNDNELILKVSSQNCKCDVGFEKMQNIILMNLIDTKLKSNVYTCVLQIKINTSNNYTDDK